MPDILSSPAQFSATLFEVMKRLNPAIAALELYEFRYCLDNLIPESGNWASVALDPMTEIEQRVNDISFYRAIQIKPRLGERIVLDPTIVRLTNMLFTGLVTGIYPEAWVCEHFYFDLRGFFFLHRTVYFTPSVLAHLGGQPVRRFEPKQAHFGCLEAVGYQAFKAANAELDQCFTETVQKLVVLHGTPILLAIAGPTAAGKTEIVARLRSTLEAAGHTVSAIELDNFLTDREPREARGIFTQGKEALHYELLKQSLAAISQGQKISIPRYDFVYATSSHDEQGLLKPGGVPIEIEPADIIFMEGNFPFLLPEIAQYIRVKVVYLTQDDIRLKRKWKRDIDYRKKYEPTYFRNRYFKDQFIMAKIAYCPQLEVCDLAVDTTGAALWATPEMAAILGYA